MIEEYLQRMGYNHLATTIITEGEFLADVAERVHATHILRGIRNAKDLGDELELKMFNDKYKPGIRTVFVSPPPELIGVSSSIVKGCVGLSNWKSALKEYTTPYVISELETLYPESH
jgi:pantetheine-phosphate adenylyltransferase